MLNIIPIIAVMLILVPLFFWTGEARKSDTERLFDDMLRRGLSPQEQRDEMAFRVTVVKVQRLASEKVLAGASAFDATRAVAEAHCSELARIDRPLAARILRTLSGLPVDELLLPEALEVHEARWRGFKAPQIDPDVRAALRLR